MNWTELLKSEANVAYDATFGLIDFLEESDLSWKPASGENWMTVGQLLKHIADACGYCCRAFVTGQWGQPAQEVSEAARVEMSDEATLPLAENMPAVENIAQAKSLLQADREIALAAIEEAGEEALAMRRTSAPWNPDSQVILGQRLFSMIAHLLQHKGQLFYYLKLMGRDVNTVHLWGG
jgi:uncharacterized damage-inducible protein DinB